MSACNGVGARSRSCGRRWSRRCQAPGVAGVHSSGSCASSLRLTPLRDAAHRPANDDSVTEPVPRLGDLVEVADVDTVVRLDGTGDRLGELVLTGDVVDSLGAVLEVANTAVGAGFFVVGPFGSGKSPFLAAVGELLAGPSVAAGATAWDSGLRGLAAGARRSLIVAVP